MQLNGSQIFVEVLCEQGVDTLFGYPGGAVLNLYDELYKNADRITHVLTAHEQRLCPPCAMWILQRWNCFTQGWCGRPPVQMAVSATTPSAAIRIHA